MRRNYNEHEKRRLCTREEHYLDDPKFFLLGTYCRVDDDEHYLVCINNDTCEVTAVDVGAHVSIKLVNSIE